MCAIAACGSGGGDQLDAGGDDSAPIVCTDQCHYVRAGAAGDGSDWTSALPSVPAVLVRGHVYFLAAGDYGSIELGDAGSEPITIIKATAANHGTSVGWQDAYAAPARFTGIWIHASNYVVDGSTGGGPGLWASNFGITVSTTPTAASCPTSPTGCADTGQRTPPPNLLAIEGGAANIVIRHVEAFGANNNYPISGLHLDHTSHVTLAQVSVHTVFGALFYVGADNDHVVVEHSYFADVRSTAIDDPLGFCGCWHGAGLAPRGQNDDFTFRFNIWDRIGGTAVFDGINVGVNNRWQIYGNVFSRSNPTFAFAFVGGSSNQQQVHGLQFHHNNIVNRPGPITEGVIVDQGSDNHVYDNIWFHNDANAFALTQDPSAAASRGAYWWWSSTWYQHQNLRDERDEAFTTMLWEGVHAYT